MLSWFRLDMKHAGPQSPSSSSPPSSTKDVVDSKVQGRVSHALAALAADEAEINQALALAKKGPAITSPPSSFSISRSLSSMSLTSEIDLLSQQIAHFTAAFHDLLSHSSAPLSAASPSLGGVGGGDRQLLFSLRENLLRSLTQTPTSDLSSVSTATVKGEEKTAAYAQNAVNAQQMAARTKSTIHTERKQEGFQSPVSIDIDHSSTTLFSPATGNGFVRDGGRYNTSFAELLNDSSTVEASAIVRNSQSPSHSYHQHHQYNQQYRQQQQQQPSSLPVHHQYDADSSFTHASFDSSADVNVVREARLARLSNHEEELTLYLKQLMLDTQRLDLERTMLVNEKKHLSPNKRKKIKKDELKSLQNQLLMTQKHLSQVGVRTCIHSRARWCKLISAH